MPKYTTGFTTKPCWGVHDAEPSHLQSWSEASALSAFECLDSYLRFKTEHLQGPVAKGGGQSTRFLRA